MKKKINERGSKGEREGKRMKRKKCKKYPTIVFKNVDEVEGRNLFYFFMVMYNTISNVSPISFRALNFLIQLHKNVQQKRLSFNHLKWFDTENLIFEHTDKFPKHEYCTRTSFFNKWHRRRFSCFFFLRIQLLCMMWPMWCIFSRLNFRQFWSFFLCYP